MKLGRAWGLFVLASLAAGVGCATATPFDGSAGDDGGASGDDSSTAHDSSSHHDSSNDSATSSDSPTSNDSATGFDASTFDTGTSRDSAPPRDSATTRDTGTTTCSPQSVSGYTPTFVSPNAKTTACTTAAINAIYTGCLDAAATNATCTAAQTANSACYGCIFTNDTAATWGPVVIESNGTVRVNVGGCIQLADTSQSTCAHSVESRDGCDDAACKAVCTVTDNASFAAYQSCVTSAESGGCATYASSASCVNNIPTTSPAYTCVSGATFQALYDQIVPVFCGP